MGGPTGQHFLARQAYLRFFCRTSKPGQIYLYLRGKRPVPTSIANVAKTRHLYSFQDVSGQLNHTIEIEVFAPLDGYALPIMERLNNERGEVRLNRTETETLIIFLAFQLVRTPAFRDDLYRFDADMAEKVRTSVKLEEMKEFLEREIGVIPPDDEVRHFWEGASQRIIERFSTSEYWLRNMGRFARRFADQIATKRPELLRAPSEYFVTSDYPVVINHGLGLGGSDLYFPVGSHTALYFHAKPERELPQTVQIPSTQVSAHVARELNKRAMLSAERYMYAAVERDGLRRLFDKTVPPQRMKAPHPMSEILAAS
jgi:hypothetical protein